MRSDRDRLTDILEAIEKIREKCPSTPEELFVRSSSTSGLSTTSR
jgi:hypothetical protein